MTRYLIVMLLGACAAPPARSAEPASGLASEPALAWRERGPGGLVPIDPGTAEPDLLSAAACGACHEAEHRAWQTSRHALAWTNGIFRREYGENPRPWCIHCHAPLVPQVAEARAGGGPLADEGVGCAACHVRAGRIVARARRPGSPHDTVVARGFGGPAFCGGCHEFPFPVFDHDGEVRRLSSLPMQATVSQFLAARRAGAVPAPGIDDGCRTCHAADAAGHAYPGAHDPAMLARALRFDVCREGQAPVAVIEIENRGAGHNVPTGDIHRHMVARAWRSSAPERLFEAFLGRRFAIDPAGGKRTTWDSTLAPGERRRYRVPLASLGGEADEPVAFELRYVYVRDEHPRQHPGEPTFRIVAERRARAEDLLPCAP